MKTGREKDKEKEIRSMENLRKNGKKLTKLRAQENRRINKRLHMNRLIEIHRQTDNQVKKRDRQADRQMEKDRE